MKNTLYKGSKLWMKSIMVITWSPSTDLKDTNIPIKDPTLIQILI